MVDDFYIPEGMPSDYKSNGCGDGWRAKFIPNTIYGKNIRPACRVHDYMYEVGTIGSDKDFADQMFRNNLEYIIENTPWYYPTWLAKRRVRVYVWAVVAFGEEAFWKGKK